MNEVRERQAALFEGNLLPHICFSCRHPTAYGFYWNDVRDQPSDPKGIAGKHQHLSGGTCGHAEAGN